ncbi:MAG: hypothetical protein AB8F26_13040 [Phycisphaerales bacterium]
MNVRRVLGETGTQSGQFRYPRGMDTFELNGRTILAVVDKTARIQLLDLDTGDTIGSLRTPKSDLGMPTGLTVAPFPGEPGTPALWVANTHEHQVIIYRLPFDHDGSPTEPDFAFGSYGYGPGEFIYPTDIAVQLDADGSPERVFISEYGGNDRVCEFRVEQGDGEPKLVFERQIGFSGVAMDAPEDDPASLARPQSILVWNEAELIVADAGRGRIVRFDLVSGQPIAWTDGSTDMNSQPIEPMRYPYGMAMVEDGVVAVSEFGGSCIRLLDLDSSQTIRIIGSPGRLEGQIATPWGATVVDNELVILDSGNDRLQIVDWNGVEG